jgi:hypothetical protein
MDWIWIIQQTGYFELCLVNVVHGPWAGLCERSQTVLRDGHPPIFNCSMLIICLTPSQALCLCNSINSHKSLTTTCENMRIIKKDKICQCYCDFVNTLNFGVRPMGWTTQPERSRCPSPWVNPHLPVCLRKHRVGKIQEKLTFSY